MSRRTRIERVSPEFSELLNKLKTQTNIPKVKLTEQIAKEFKYTNSSKGELIIDLWPIKHKAKLVKL